MPTYSPSGEYSRPKVPKVVVVSKAGLEPPARDRVPIQLTRLLPLVLLPHRPRPHTAAPFTGCGTSAIETDEEMGCG